MQLLALAPLLSDGWRDVISIASLILSVLGLAATVVGLWYAIDQIRKTKSAADAAKEAADEALTESRESYNRYTAANAHRLLKEVKIHVQGEVWILAAVRLADLADQVAQLANEDPEWKPFADELREWEAACQRRARGVKKRFAVDKWGEFTRRLQAQMDSWSGPFPPATQETTDDT
jgi:hypothetical protein